VGGVDTAGEVADEDGGAKWRSGQSTRAGAASRSVGTPYLPLRD
jgi:hypothetical protein